MTGGVSELVLFASGMALGFAAGVFTTGVVYAIGRRDWRRTRTGTMGTVSAAHLQTLQSEDAKATRVP